MKTVTFVMTFLGAAEKNSKKSGNDYFIAKFMDEDSEDVVEFYVAGEGMEHVKQLKKYKPYSVTLGMRIYQGKISLDFVAAADIK